MPRLGALSLSPASMPESAAVGGAVGIVEGATTGSTLAQVDDAGGRFALAGGAVQRSATALDNEIATSHTITLRETNANNADSPRDTAITITLTNVFEQPALAALMLSGTATEGRRPRYRSWARRRAQSSPICAIGLLRR